MLIVRLDETIKTAFQVFVSKVALNLNFFITYSCWKVIFLSGDKASRYEWKYI